jgi:N-acetylglucosamine kinase-like BadF-type ATPase
MFIGIDGGGTKTRGVLADNEGHVIRDVTLGPSNHQTIGYDACHSLLQALKEALLSGIDEPLSFVYLGLSGADTASDFKVLNTIVSSVFPTTPFLVENDSWCVLKSATPHFGVVSIYGTGANAGAIDKQGHRYILRSLGYALGGYGGGGDLANEALHYAFRADEGTYLPTKLTTEIPKLAGLTNMSELLDLMYPEVSVPESFYKQLPPLLFDLADQNDVVAIEILQKMGRLQGEMICPMIIKADLAKDAFPVVLGGSVYNGSSPHFIDATMETIWKIAPLASPIRPKLPPVAGALIIALEEIHVNLTTEILLKIQNYFTEFKN